MVASPSRYACPSVARKCLLSCAERTGVGHGYRIHFKYVLCVSSQDAVVPVSEVKEYLLFHRPDAAASPPFDADPLRTDWLSQGPVVTTSPAMSCSTPGAAALVSCPTVVKPH